MMQKNCIQLVQTGKELLWLVFKLPYQNVKSKLLIVWSFPPLILIMSTLDVVFSHYVCYILVGTYIDLQDTSETGNLKGDMNIYTKTFHNNQSVPRAPMVFIFKIFWTKTAYTGRSSVPQLQYWNSCVWQPRQKCFKRHCMNY